MMLVAGIAAFAQEGYVSSPIVKAMEGGKFYMKLGAVQAISDSDLKADKVEMIIETATKGGVSMSRSHMQVMDGVILSTPEGSFRLDESAKTWTAQPMASDSFTGGKLKFVRQGSCRLNGQDGSTRAGACGYDGRIRIPFEYDSIISYYMDEQTVVVGKNGNIGIISFDGKLIIPLKYKDFWGINEDGERLFLRADGKLDVYERERFKFIRTDPAPDL